MTGIVVMMQVHQAYHLELFNFLARKVPRIIEANRSHRCRTLWEVCGALVESTPFVRRVMASTPNSRHVGTLGKFVTHNCL